MWWSTIPPISTKRTNHLTLKDHDIYIRKSISWLWTGQPQQVPSRLLGANIERSTSVIHRWYWEPILKGLPQWYIVDIFLVGCVFAQIFLKKVLRGTVNNHSPDMWKYHWQQVLPVTSHKSRTTRIRSSPLTKQNLPYFHLNSGKIPSIYTMQ